jgi:hypothetical protein
MQKDLRNMKKKNKCNVTSPKLNSSTIMYFNDSDLDEILKNSKE